MDFRLSDDQQSYQAVARTFAARELTPYAAQWDIDGQFPRTALAKAGEMGFCGMYTPSQMGGLGLSRLEAALVFEELAAGCTATAAYLSIHNMATWMVARWASASVVHEWGAALASGRKLASYCLTEADSGSDASALRLRARRVGDDYVLDGSKAFISGAGETDLLVVMARTGDAGSGGISAFAVPANLPGISYGRNEEKMGWHCQPTRAIAFDQVRVPCQYLLGKEGDGFRIAMKGLDGGRVNIASCSLGAAQAALERSQAYLQQRQQFGKALAQCQALQFKLADMVTELVAARHLVRLAASKIDDESSDASTYCAMAKRFATDVGFQVCNEALQLHGGIGYIRELPLERYVRDTRVHQIVEGTNEIMRLIIARAILREGALETIR